MVSCEQTVVSLPLLVHIPCLYDDLRVTIGIKSDLLTNEAGALGAGQSQGSERSLSVKSKLSAYLAYFLSNLLIALCFITGSLT